MDCAPIRAQAWLDVHERDFGDLHLDAAVALVEAAGLQARVLPASSGWSAQEQQPDRVNLRLTRAGDLGSVDAG